MKVLLSIKPQYVEQIFKGKKKYEYRKCLFKRNDIDTVIVYATKPIGKVSGEFSVGEIIQEDPITLWKMTSKVSGILKKDYMEYFREKENAYAIGIENIKIYEQPLELQDINPNIKYAPQSFMYIDSDVV